MSHSLYDRDMRGECLVCKKTITYPFALCADCISEYGYYVENWPDWLRFLWRDKQRSRRDTLKAKEHEFSLENYLEEKDGDE